MAYRSNYSPRPAKQAWEVGQIVNVGFIKGLLVKARVATPGECRPDTYALWQPATNRFYNFQPHLGIVRCDNLEQAMAS